MNTSPVCSPFPTPAPVWEHGACSRCGGTGNYSYCQSYGTRCFKCGGRGWTLTARGSAASAYCATLRSVPTSALKVGDLVRVDIHSTMTGEIIGRAFRTVTAIESAEGKPRSVGTIDPITGQAVYPLGEPGECNVTVGKPGESGHGTHYHKAANDLWRIGQTAEQKRETQAQSLAYQATLTRKGEPSKRALK